MVLIVRLQWSAGCHDRFFPGEVGRDFRRIRLSVFNRFPNSRERQVIISRKFLRRAWFLGIAKVCGSIKVSADVINEDIGIDEVGHYGLFPAVTANAIHVIQTVFKIVAVLPQTESFDFRQLRERISSVLAYFTPVLIDFSAFVTWSRP